MAVTKEHFDRRMDEMLHLISQLQTENKLLRAENKLLKTELVQVKTSTLRTELYTRKNNIIITRNWSVARLRKSSADCSLIFWG